MNNIAAVILKSFANWYWWGLLELKDQGMIYMQRDYDVAGDQHIG